jgi:predicted kinase
MADRVQFEQGKPALANANIRYIYGSDLRKRHVGRHHANSEFRGPEVLFSGVRRAIFKVVIVVLVNGLPGSGKTTVARALGGALGLPVFSKDDLKETLADMLERPAGMSVREWSRQLGTAAGESMWTLLGRAGRGAVMESPWLAPLRPVVLAGLARAGVEPSRVREVWCDVPPELARRRYEGRVRHPIHCDAEVDDARWREWAKGAEPLALGPVYWLDTSKSVDISGLAELCDAPQ